MVDNFSKSKRALPLVIKPQLDRANLVLWAADHRDLIETKLLQHGAILFRDFQINGYAEFEQFISKISGELIQYQDRATPRHQLQGNIYTSTEYPPHHRIFLHNENSFAYTWPGKICFFCISEPQQGGETPIADVRRVFQRINPKIRETFIQKQVMYVRNFGDGFGLPWQTVFNTEDKGVLEEYCHSAGIEVEWKNENHLRTSQVRPAVAKHPQTGELVWFNHATVLNVSTLPSKLCQAMLAEFELGDLPNNTYYGDRSEIEAGVLAELRHAYEQETVTFSWQKGDVLMLDNMLVAHGREPFVGQREIVVGMAQPLSWQDLELVTSGDSLLSSAINRENAIEEQPQTRQQPQAQEQQVFALPRTPVEKVLALIWAEALRRKQIGIHDTFLDLGGQSLEAIDIIAEVQDTFQVKLSLRALIHSPTIAQLAETLLQDPNERAKIEKLAQLAIEVAQLSTLEVEKLLNEEKIYSGEAAK